MGNENGLAKPGKCHNCKQAGHWHGYSPKPPNPNSTPYDAATMLVAVYMEKVVTVVAMVLEVERAGKSFHLVCFR